MLRTVLPRAGYAALGLLYVTIGLIAARIGFLGSRDRLAGMPGALRFLLRQKEGPWILTGVAAGLLALAAWRLIQALTARRSGFITRAGWLIAAIGHGVVAWMGFRLLARARGGERFERAGLGWMISHPFGRVALQLAGVLLLLAGVIAIGQAVTGRLPRWLVATGFGPRARRVAARVSRVGLAARGIVQLVIGYYLMRAVRDLNPQEVREIGGSLLVLSKSPLGPLAMGVVAVGLIWYGVSMWVLAISRRPI